MSCKILVLPRAAQTAGQSSKPEEIRKRMSLHKPFHMRYLGQFVSDMLGHPQSRIRNSQCLPCILCQLSDKKIPEKEMGTARLFRRRSRPTAGPQSRLQSQTLRRLFYPIGAAERRATVHALLPHRLRLVRRQSLIDPIEPSTRPLDRPRRQVAGTRRFVLL
jgi:hypothetical protein